ncbi:MAG: hypothetical protein AB7V42_16810 [Thermoleophilia bacterium]
MTCAGVTAVGAVITEPAAAGPWLVLLLTALIVQAAMMAGGSRR